MKTTNNDAFFTYSRANPIHPGEILREELLTPLGISPQELALALGMSVTFITDIINENLGITAETALRLARYFGTSSRFWVELQVCWELQVAEKEFGAVIRRDVNPRTG